MRCSLCGFLIIKPQTALHHVVWCSAVHYYLRCGVVMPFCRQFWCSFCGLCDFYGLVNTPSCSINRNKSNRWKMKVVQGKHTPNSGTSPKLIFNPRILHNTPRIIKGNVITQLS